MKPVYEYRVGCCTQHNLAQAPRPTSRRSPKIEYAGMLMTTLGVDVLFKDGSSRPPPRQINRVDTSMGEPKPLTAYQQTYHWRVSVDASLTTAPPALSSSLPCAPA
jgi:hypothetical protein